MSEMSADHLETSGDKQPEDELPEITEEEKQRIVSALIKMMELGMSAVYGDEDPETPEAVIDCQSRLPGCEARCCTLNFALTKDEVKNGIIRHNPKRPYFIARDPDGYCPHLDRDTLTCREWDSRPLRCRRYDCTKEPHAN